MGFVSQLVQVLASPLVAAADALAPAIAEARHRPAGDGDFTVAAFAISVAFLGLLVVWWAAYTRARAANERIDARLTESRLRGAIALRDRLLMLSRSAVVVLGRALRNPLSYGGAAQSLKDCMAGPDAAHLASALDALLKEGVPFERRSRSAKGETFSVMGRPAGQVVAVSFEKLFAGEGELDHRSALAAMPTAVWVRRTDLSLIWGNRAFLELVQAETLEAAILRNTFVERSEKDLAVGARDGGPVASVRRYAMSGGRRRVVSISLIRLSDGNLLGMAVDVTEAAEAEAKLKVHVETYANLLDRIPVAIANFGADRRLSHYNSAYAQLWSFDDRWLAARPSIDEILDRLRDAGRLPEQRDFRAWKEEHLRPFEDRSRYTEEVWHTSGEKSVKVQAQPDLEGGVFYLFEDVSERLRLTGKLALLTKVQRATLDTVDEGLAIFDPDGRLATYNSAFVRSWQLNERDLADAPHFSRVAALCIAQKGRDSVWDIVSAGLTSGEPERYAEWGKVTRADGRVIAVSMSHLPNGAIVVMFKDLTDLERFSEAFRENPPAAA